MYGSTRGGHTSCYMLIGCRLLGEMIMSYPAVKNGWVNQSISEWVIEGVTTNEAVMAKGTSLIRSS